MDTERIKAKLSDIEKNLIEQEHRPLQVITNYLWRKKKWPNDDERQLSAKKAIIWRFLFSPAVVAGTGGLIAFISIGVLIWQTSILKEQNDLFRDQNQYFQEQNQFFRRQLTADDLKNNLQMLSQSESLPPSVIRQALIDYISLFRSLDTVKTIQLSNFVVEGVFRDEKELFKKVEFNNVDFRAVKFIEVDFSKVEFNECKFRFVPNKNIYPEEPFAIGNTFIDDEYRCFPVLFEKCHFQDVTFSNETFEGVVFFNSIFDNSNFSMPSDRFESINSFVSNEGLGDFASKEIGEEITRIYSITEYLNKEKNAIRQIYLNKTNHSEYIYDEIMSLEKKYLETSLLKGVEYSEFIDPNSGEYISSIATEYVKNKYSAFLMDHLIHYFEPKSDSLWNERKNSLKHPF